MCKFIMWVSILGHGHPECYKSVPNEWRSEPGYPRKFIIEKSKWRYENSSIKKK